MPLSEGCSVKAFRDNISKMIREGRPRDQAVAAAYRQLKASCRRLKKPLPSTGGVWGLFDPNPQENE